MMLDKNFLEQMKAKTLDTIQSEMSTKEKQKGLAKHIIWTEPMNDTMNDLSQNVSFPEVKRILDNPINFENDITTLT
jgi:hypothetical protein